MAWEAKGQGIFGYQTVKDFEAECSRLKLDILWTEEISLHRWSTGTLLSEKAYHYGTWE